jgi:DmsE family decaheme c-type cytochrome
VSRRIALALGFAALCALALPELPTAAEPEPPLAPGEAKPAEPSPPPGYVGDETCLACHEAQHPGMTKKYQATVHAHVLNAKNARTPLATHGCEACHGPGEAHVNAGGGKGVGGLVPFDSAVPADVARANDACLQCHKAGERTYWKGSVHHLADVACTTCHTVMENVSPSSLLSAATEVQTCGGCHQTQYSRVYRNAHMPLRPGDFQVSTQVESKMSCSSCHQPHGSVTKALISHLTVNEQCTSCHAEKRGPFLWEHAPVTEDCLNCHEPHGGTRRAMLKLNVIRLCQTCHVSTGHATNPRLPNDRFAVATSCLQCHTQVHGSNHPSGFALTR